MKNFISKKCLWTQRLSAQRRWSWRQRTAKIELKWMPRWNNLFKFWCWQTNTIQKKFSSNDNYPIGLQNNLYTHKKNTRRNNVPDCWKSAKGGRRYRALPDQSIWILRKMLKYKWEERLINTEMCCFMSKHLLQEPVSHNFSSCLRSTHRLCSVIHLFQALLCAQYGDTQVFTVSEAFRREL